jgi:peptidoglycan hydrolase CwlO-like protein
MDKATLEKYAPFALIIIAIILQWNVFVTPAQLEVKHREILKEVSEVYTTKEMSNDLKSQLNDMQKKIDKIYEKIMSK